MSYNFGLENWDWESFLVGLVVAYFISFLLFYISNDWKKK